MWEGRKGVKEDLPVEVGPRRRIVGGEEGGEDMVKAKVKKKFGEKRFLEPFLRFKRFFGGRNRISRGGKKERLERIV